MKILKRYFIPVIAILISLILFFTKNSSQAENCCNGGRCNGSAYCSACKNCSRCAHCKGGGTCGACSSPKTSYKAPKTTYKVSTPKHTSSKKETTPSTKTKVNSSKVYIVNATALNVRSAPSTTSSILYTLKYGDVVTVLKVVDENWYKIQVTNVVGYVYQQYVRQ